MDDATSHGRCSVRRGRYAAPAMKAMLLLCDSAQVADGKLFILGGGWNIVGPEPAPMGLAMLFEVPWDRANEQHQLKLEIVDADGDPVMIVQREAAEPEPLVIQAGFEVGRPRASSEARR